MINKTALTLVTCAIALSAGSSVFAAEKSVQAGNYLSAYSAQKQHDWNNANKFIGKIVESGIDTESILLRAMILSIGSGNVDDAINLAKRLKNGNSNNTIGEILLIIEAFKNQNFEKAEKLFKSLPNDGTTRFISPFITSWLDAAQGRLNINELQNNTMQLYHGILISDFLNDYSVIEKMIDKALNVEDINIEELERIAALYAHIGLKNKAIAIYTKILKSQPNNEYIKIKISDVSENKNADLFKKIKSANQGMAKSLLDISNILYSENNDDSARIFANISLYLDNKMGDSQFLLADISKTHRQYSDAIFYYKSIKKSDENYINAQYEIADIYEETGHFRDAYDLLSDLLKEYQDIDTIIKIGNLYRNQEKFELALKSYKEAINKLGGIVPKEYWHLHYVQGIAYEQLDDWELAEKELKAALKFKPDHPYVLNYLGYAWADKGVNLEEALKMIKRAVDLKPSDGYITDSLGWAMYRSQNYKKAVPVLEQAVELLPYDPTVNDHLGDAYWKVGRKLEAKFQWKRAKNHSDDNAQVQKIESKLTSGLKH